MPEPRIFTLPDVLAALAALASLYPDTFRVLLLLRGDGPAPLLLLDIPAGRK